MARLLGVKQITVSQWEAGLRPGRRRPQTLQRRMAAFQVWTLGTLPKTLVRPSDWLLERLNPGLVLADVLDMQESAFLGCPPFTIGLEFPSGARGNAGRVVGW